MPIPDEDEQPEVSAQPESYPSPLLEEPCCFAPARTPKKGKSDGERLDGNLAWTLGGELPQTMSPQSPWTKSFTGEAVADDLEAIEAELAKLEILVGTHSFLSKSDCSHPRSFYPKFYNNPSIAQDCNG